AFTTCCAEMLLACASTECACKPSPLFFPTSITHPPRSGRRSLSSSLLIRRTIFRGSVERWTRLERKGYRRKRLAHVARAPPPANFGDMLNQCSGECSSRAGKLALSEVERKLRATLGPPHYPITVVCSGRIL